MDAMMRRINQGHASSTLAPFKCASEAKHSHDSSVLVQNALRNLGKTIGFSMVRPDFL